MIELLLANWKMIAIAILIAATCTFAELWDHSRTDLIEYKASIAATAKAAEEENARIARAQLQNLEVLKADYEAHVNEVRSGAVAAYLARLRAVAGTSGMYGAGTGIKLDDAARCEQIPDSDLIQAAAEDALKLGSWQEYAKLNHIPVKD